MHQTLGINQISFLECNNMHYYKTAVRQAASVCHLLRLSGTLAILFATLTICQILRAQTASNPLVLDDFSRGLRTNQYCTDCYDYQKFFWWIPQQGDLGVEDPNQKLTV